MYMHIILTAFTYACMFWSFVCGFFTEFVFWEMIDSF